MRYYYIVNRIHEMMRIVFSPIFGNPVRRNTCSNQKRLFEIGHIISIAVGQLHQIGR
jgi:hypothetical protein